MESEVTDYQNYTSVRLYPAENREVIIHFEVDTIIVAMSITDGIYTFYSGKEFEKEESLLCQKAREVLKNRWFQMELRG